MVVDSGPHAGFLIHNNLNDLATICPVENSLVVVESVSGPQMSGFLVLVPGLLVPLHQEAAAIPRDHPR